jgi:hypothetical protein
VHVESLRELLSDCEPSLPSAEAMAFPHGESGEDVRIRTWPSRNRPDAERGFSSSVDSQRLVPVASGAACAFRARPRRCVHAGILRIFVGSALRLAGLGVAAAGSLVAFPAGRLLTGLLYGVGPGDPATFLAAAAVLLSVALLASLLPARRAASTDPFAALRPD